MTVLRPDRGSWGTDVLIDRTSVTDTEAWRSFCVAAAEDLSLIGEEHPTLDYVISGYAFARSRYLKIARRMQMLYGPWTGWLIVEVGAGYGGQAEVLLGLHPCRYATVDLPEPAALQKAYLASKGFALEESYESPADLFLSNYAMSECTREVQEQYLRLAAACPRGYITWNGWSLSPLAQTKEEYQAMIPGSRWISEDPPSPAPWNSTLVWGTQI